MKAVIFGANGQDGYYLTRLCQKKDIEAIPISRSGDLYHADVSNYEEVEQLIRYHTPNYVFHLAANSTTRHNALFENHATIATGTLNILEAVYKYSPGTRVFVTGSGLQFENKGEAITENDQFVANSPYSIARIQSVYAARYYRSLGLKTYVGYLFHHESTLRKPHHISKKIVLATQRIAQGSNELIEIGDVTAQKEWTFAGDVAAGIFTLINQENIFETVIGSGIAYSIENWLEECFSLIGKDWQNYVKAIDDYHAEYSFLVSQPKTINSLGWLPIVKFSDLSAMMMNNVI